MAESTGLLNLRRATVRGFESLSLRHFFLLKKMANEDVSLLFTLLCQQKLFTQNRRFSSHLHQAAKKTYLLVHRSLVRRWMKTFRLRSTCLSRRNEMKPDEVFSLPPSPRLRRTSREYGWCSFLYCASLTRRRCRLNSIVIPQKITSYFDGP